MIVFSTGFFLYSEPNVMMKSAEVMKNFFQMNTFKNGVHVTNK